MHFEDIFTYKGFLKHGGIDSVIMYSGPMLCWMILLIMEQIL